MIPTRRSELDTISEELSSSKLFKRKSRGQMSQYVIGFIQNQGVVFRFMRQKIALFAKIF